MNRKEQDPHHIHRLLDLKHISEKKSVFLFGPRLTGKSSLLRHQIPDANVIDLLDAEVFIALSRDPSRLSEYVLKTGKPIVVDEIQRIPELLNEVHRLIESKKWKFILTGSSARSLRKRGVNLLGGRASIKHLFPFNSTELGDLFSLERAIQYGTMPSVYLSDEPWNELKDYVDAYLKFEIQQEALTRQLGNFTRFLEAAASHNGGILNYEKISSQAQVTRSTSQNYFQILRDTLIADDLDPLKTKGRHPSVRKSKFYFFDVGIVNFILGLKNLAKNSSDYGRALESYIYHELRSFCEYRQKGDTLNFWRSLDQFEVDFILNEEIAIEVKATKRVIPEDLKGLKALNEVKKMKKLYLLCHEKHPRKMDGVNILPIEEWGQVTK